MAPLPTSSSTSPLSRVLLSLPMPNSSRHTPPPSCSHDTASKKPSALVLSRRDAVAAVLSGAILSRVLPAVADAEEPTPKECLFQYAPSGLGFCDLVEGTGAAAEKGKVVKVHYTGRLDDGTVFDSSYKSGKPVTFRAGMGEVIKAWDEGLVGGDGIPPMLVGGKRTLRVPPYMAYGDKGKDCKFWDPTDCRIPPSTVLLFDVEYLG